MGSDQQFLEKNRLGVPCLHQRLQISWEVLPNENRTKRHIYIHDTFKIHSRYIHDTFMIHSRHIQITFTNIPDTFRLHANRFKPYSNIFKLHSYTFKNIHNTFIIQLEYIDIYDRFNIHLNYIKKLHDTLMHCHDTWYININNRFMINPNSMIHFKSFSKIHDTLI